jgi:sugar/nucleoside kinase (ribokinase family)
MIDDSYDVLGLGAACIDLLIPVSEKFLQTLPGIKGGAMAISLEEMNRIINERGIEPYMATGGSCANAIKGLSHSGASCAFLSVIGPDPLGQYFQAHMHQMGIAPLFFLGHQPTTRVLCLVTPDKERTMRFFSGCSDEFSLQYLNPTEIQKAKLVHIDAYTLRNENVTKRMMQLAKQMDVKVSLDLSSFEIVKQFYHTLHELLPNYVDIVFGNQNEVKALTGLGPYEGCAKLKEMCSIAVVLRGAKGCLVGHRNRVFSSPAFPVKVVDTTGAGDLFASGFLYGYLKGYPLQECARMGNRLGKAIVEVIGAELPARA